jgi:uncharacterized membrane protein
MSEKPIKVTDKAKKPAIILFFVLVFLLVLKSPLSTVGMFEMLGSLTAHIFFGIIIGNIYFLLKKSKRTNWQRYKVILILSLAFFVFKAISQLF